MVSGPGALQLQLQLTYELIPRNAPLFAEEIAVQGRERGINLDYSADSIGYFDSVITSLRAQSVTVEQVAEVLLGFGCYLGEAVVRATGGSWVSSLGTPLEKLAPLPMVVTLPSGEVCDPAGRPFAALTKGSRSTLVSFYEEYAAR
ncbi:hypothetical protein [Glaciihabitans sp. dw_435]|uniref:hypothetical protein n=1 Tax=Glaciihabitans sp. dw_435 TaxID=2720081 RepID=UPI001BD213EF|nr:hypothetical protein [Glaciihabitans sp. dw_435]